MGIKEHIAMRGFYATCGLATFCEAPCTEDAVLVTLLKEAGAIPLVRSNVPQLLMLPESDNGIYGNAVNPYNPGFTPGGSSGGEGAVIASRCAPVGVGTDIGGSIRIPSNFCGIYGFKPTSTRVSYKGCVEPREGGFDGQTTIPSACGPMGRCVDDLVLMMRAWGCGGGGSGDGMRREDARYAGRPFDMGVYAPPAPRRLRIGVMHSDGFFTPARAVTRAVEEAADALRAAGHEVVPWEPGAHGLDTYRAALDFYGIVGADGGACARAPVKAV